MAAIEVLPGDDNVTITIEWDGTPGCRYEQVHHRGEDGKHYCPTGFVVCVAEGDEHRDHGGSITRNGRAWGECRAWDRKP